MEENMYFNVKLEFDHEKVENDIINAIDKGTPHYVCAIESNNLTVANKNPQFRQIVNSSLVNCCDGSVVAKMLGIIHHKPFDSYTGNDLFMRMIGMKRFRHFFLGNTPEVLGGLRKQLTAIDPKIEGMRFETLPFRNVEEFDYKAIAKLINADYPDIIWVSLGAPKQEMFMAKLKPYLRRGVMVGIGAAFNFQSNTGSVKRAPQWMIRLRLEWLYRACEEPKKNVPRYWGFIKILPKLLYSEKAA